MKGFFSCMTLAVVTCVAVGSVAAAPPKKRNGNQTIHGHTLLSQQKIKSLKNGKYHVHTTQTGHKVHTHLRRGKVADVSVTDRRGRNVRVTKRVVRRPIGRAGVGRADVTRVGGPVGSKGLVRDQAGVDDGAAILPVGGGFQMWVCYGFSCNGRMIYICFPQSSCHSGGATFPGGDADPGGEDSSDGNDLPDVDDLDN